MSEKDNKILPIPHNPTLFLSRIDRSIADNIHDVRLSFGEDAGLVLDLIMFFSIKLKSNLFGFTEFTLKELASATGIPVKSLSNVHPNFIQSQDNPKPPKIPEYNGHQFKTVLDYTLFTMLQKNIIFQRSYKYKSYMGNIELQNLPILTDVNLKRNKNGTVKVYDVRLSRELISGFLSRYYTIETEGYAALGKGKNAEGRKALYLFMFKNWHILASQHHSHTITNVDYLANIANIDSKEPRHRKQSLQRMLDTVKQVTNLAFNYEFIYGGPGNGEKFHISITYTDQLDQMKEKKGEQKFYFVLYEICKSFFQKSVDPGNIIDKDIFQRWLVADAHIKEKVDFITKAYLDAFEVNIPPAQAREILDGFKNVGQ